MADPDRPHAMLTQDQREFLRRTLRGEEVYEGTNAGQQRYQMRNRIRERVRASICDFSLLFEALDERDRDHIFNPGATGEPIEEFEAFENGVIDTIAFLYLCTVGGSKVERTQERTFVAAFDILLDRGVSRAEVRRRGEEPSEDLVDVDFSVTFTDPSVIDPAGIAYKLAEGDAYDISDSELRAFVLRSMVDGDFAPGEVFGRIEHYTTHLLREREKNEDMETQGETDDTVDEE